MSAEWRIIPSAPQYMASEDGTIMRSAPACGAVVGRILSFVVGRHGYKVAGIMVGKRRKSLFVHRMVCEAFHGLQPSAQHIVAHLDGNKLNCAQSNVCWATRRENEEHKKEHGTALIGTRHNMSKLTEAKVLDIRARYRTGHTKNSIAKEYNISPYTVYNVVSRKNWRHIP